MVVFDIEEERQEGLMMESSMIKMEECIFKKCCKKYKKKGRHCKKCPKII